MSPAKVPIGAVSNRSTGAPRGRIRNARVARHGERSLSPAPQRRFRALPVTRALAVEVTVKSSARARRTDAR